MNNTSKTAREHKKTLRTSKICRLQALKFLAKQDMEDIQQCVKWISNKQQLLMALETEGMESTWEFNSTETKSSIGGLNLGLKE